MSDPFLFDSATPRLRLPLLFAGQVQKEAFVNEAHALVDALLHAAVEGRSVGPPTAPVDGESWLVAAPATGAWSGREGQLACRQSGNWLFVVPRDGMRVIDRSTGQELLHFSDQWHAGEIPAEPSGGSVVDAEARVAIQQIIAALRLNGVLPAP